MKSRTTWFKRNLPATPGTVDPEGVHLYLACQDGLWLYPAKDTNRRSPLPAHTLANFSPVAKETVPMEMRRRTAIYRKRAV